jgi:hypothetical protein
MRRGLCATSHGTGGRWSLGSRSRPDERGAKARGIDTGRADDRLRGLCGVIPLYDGRTGLLHRTRLPSTGSVPGVPGPAAGGTQRRGRGRTRGSCAGGRVAGWARQLRWACQRRWRARSRRAAFGRTSSHVPGRLCRLRSRHRDSLPPAHRSTRLLSGLLRPAAAELAPVRLSRGAQARRRRAVGRERPRCDRLNRRRRLFRLRE